MPFLSRGGDLGAAIRAARRRLRETGAIRGAALVVHRALWLAARRLLGPRTFEVDGRRLPYLIHPFVLDNERAVELALALDEIRRRPGDRLLEVGHVLAPFTAVERTVVDKYEKAPGVRNVDVLDLDPAVERYDLIVSLSTLEHVGHDEAEARSAKALDALRHLESLLAPGGRLFVTFPIDSNPALDDALAQGTLGLTRLACFERVGRWNSWRACSVEAVLRRGYGAPFRCANGLVAGWIDR